MGRSRKRTDDSRSVQARGKILRAAVKLFSRQGYHRTTIAELAQAIGQTSGAIFHYFSSKEAILDAVVDWLARGLKAYSDVMAQAPTGSYQMMEQVLLVMREHYKRNPEATICLAALATEFAGSNHPIEKRLKEVYEVFVDGFARSLGNHLYVEDPRAAAIAFLGSVQGIAVQGLLREKEYEIDALADAYLSMMARW
ncbi:MAG: helix-turn-helix domain-containing protein [Desulforhabdus sp.]|jgi:AcrR family transcriptional regulator|nr:helix-turn-helix domain-containing protein [Desulforhabdus sp.]